MSDYRELTADELAALKAYAKAYGRTWKGSLTNCWLSGAIWMGPEPGMGNLLQTIRNDFGPTWLYDVFKLPKVEAP